MAKQTLSELATARCLPCEGGVPPSSLSEATEYLKFLLDWQLTEDGKSIFAKPKSDDFLGAIKILNVVAEIAEEEQHHPDFHLTGYRNLKIVLTTHAIGGLSENDFILAAKISSALQALRS